MSSSIADLSGAGRRAWASEYARTGGSPLDYQSIGSSAGLQKIKAKEVVFGASDVAPPEDDLARNDLVLMPMFVTGAVPVVNLPGIPKGALKLTGPVLARLFLGTIERWNAPEIQELNPGLKLPALGVKPVVRSDGSGTTYYVTDYLTRVSDDWRAKYPKPATAVTWPDVALGAKGSDGVAAAVLATPGAIGYIDFNYVTDKGLSPVAMKDALGEFVDARPEAFSSALRASDWFLKGDFHGTLANLPGKQAWPITMGTFVNMRRVPDDADKANDALRFFVWAWVRGDQLVDAMSFVRLPDKIQALAYRNMSTIVSRDGNQLGLSALTSTMNAPKAR